MRYGLRADEPVPEGELNDALTWLDRLNHVQLLRLQCKVEALIGQTRVLHEDPEKQGDDTMVMALNMKDLLKDSKPET